MEEDNTQYYNDEWNGKWIKDPKKEIEIIDIKDDNKYINKTHFLYEQYSKGIISKKQLENNLIKNDKPDGRRYKK